LKAEDYSPCLKHHPAYSPPNFVTETGIEVLNRYDYGPGDYTSIEDAEPDCSIDTTLYKGRLAEVWDRGARTVSVYDGRGRVTCVARQMGKPGVPSNVLSTRYAERWYVQTAAFDAADRPVLESTGAKVPELLGTYLTTSGKSLVATSYSGRGSVKQVTSSYGVLVASVVHDADGLTTSIVYGDAASTTTAFDYDLKRRLRSVQTYRGPPSVWSGGITPAPVTTGPSTLQLVLEDLEYSYDTVDNPTEIRDWRKPADWPSGAKPVTRNIDYDDLYRVKKVDYQYSAGDDTWVSPFDAENTATGGAASDPRMAKPSPQVSFNKRVLWQSFKYDWLGNTTETDDDAKGFYDRSLGTVTNGSANAGPYQLKAASNVASLADRKGSLTAKYDDAGYLVSMAVKRDGPCLPTGAQCGQRFIYDWDEAGRLQRARRWDLAGSSVGTADDGEPSGTAAVELRYQYNAGDQRTLKTAVDPSTSDERYTVYVFGSLELRRAACGSGEYAQTPYTEVPYLFARGVRIARVAYEDSDVPSIAISNPRLHVLFELGDHLGSTSTVVDKSTSELVESSTYLAYGQADSDYRPARWKGFREDYRFTGKEEDVEAGLTYFGYRYLAPALGRWISPDPKTQHGFGADANLYAYVHARLLSATDPVGLEEGAGVDDSGHAIGVIPPAGDSDKYGPEAREKYLQQRRAEHAALIREAEQAQQQKLHHLDEAHAEANAAAKCIPLGLDWDAHQTKARWHGAAADYFGATAQGKLKKANEIADEVGLPKAVGFKEDPGNELDITTVTVGASVPLLGKGPPGTAGAATGSKLNWNDWHSRPAFGHAFDTHGAGMKNTKKLIGRANGPPKGTGTKKPGIAGPQGQWIDNDAAAKFLAEKRPGLTGPTPVDLPPGLGQIVHPDGTVTPANRAMLCPDKAGGYETAYPIK